MLHLRLVLPLALLLHLARVIQTWLLHLALNCITFTVGHFIAFSVNLCYIYGWYYISAVITFSGDTPNVVVETVRLVPMIKLICKSTATN